VNYICKYLIKPPQKGFPEWMLKTPRLRFMGSSRAIGKLVSEDDNNREKKRGDEEKRVYQVKLPYERIAECDNNLVFMQYDLKLDRDVYIGSCNARKEAVMLTPEHIEIYDFDMTAGKAFRIIGFESKEKTHSFIKNWSDSRIQEKIAGWLEAKKENVLNKE